MLAPATRFGLLGIAIACGAGCESHGSPAAAVVQAPVASGAPAPSAPAPSAPMPQVAAAPQAPDAGPPATREACEARHGIWGPFGLSPDPGCNLPTHDGGRRCTDGADCEGDCLADGDGAIETQVVSPGSPPLGFFVGRCSQYTVNFGCHRRLWRGLRDAGPSPLGTPPPMMCID
jgi:hypothetical protein